MLVFIFCFKWPVLCIFLHDFYDFFPQVEHEFIYYVHDSSETLVDNFTVEANDTGLRKHSAAQTVFIELTAVNDESPVITTNRVLRVSL